MKRYLLLLIFTLMVTGLSSCKKSEKQPFKDNPQIVPDRRNLVNTTWRKEFSPDPSRKLLYEYIYFASPTRVEIYYAYVDGTGEIPGRNICGCKMDFSDKDLVRFEITYFNGQVLKGSTTENIDILKYELGEYTRYKK
jgi:hypothetical protein